MKKKERSKVKRAIELANKKKGRGKNEVLERTL